MEELKSSKKKNKDKRVQMTEEHLKQKQQDMTFAKLKSTICLAVLMFLIYRYLNSMFGTTVVAKLPFEPMGFMASVTHRGLEGDDLFDCSMAFIYLLCSLGIRPNVQKWFGFTPKPVGVDAFGFPEPSKTS